MKFMCLCGKILSDNTDDIPYKARMIADEDWTEFTASCERPQGYDCRLVTEIYQCPDCGRLRIQKPVGGVVFFDPENETVAKSLLRSTKRATNDSQSGS
jgi:RNA polymerase subunit RPABC4/transcription elongation factor Spt4